MWRALLSPLHWHTCLQEEREREGERERERGGGRERERGGGGGREGETASGGS